MSSPMDRHKKVQIVSKKEENKYLEIKVKPFAGTEVRHVRTSELDTQVSNCCPKKRFRDLGTSLPVPPSLINYLSTVTEPF